MTDSANNTTASTIEAALYLIPTTIGDTAIDRVIPQYNVELICSIKHFIVEEVRTARRFLKKVDKSIDIDSLQFYPMGKHSNANQFAQYLEPLRKGEAVGVISEAGCPAIADPGADIVAIAQREGLKVVPLVGPSSILLTAMASGFNGQSFAFHGYLPIDQHARAKRIKQLEAISHSERQTQLFIETPYRNAKLFAELTSLCGDSTRLCIAAGITTEQEYIRSLTIKQWKSQQLPDLSKTPTVFAIYKN